MVSFNISAASRLSELTRLVPMVWIAGNVKPMICCKGSRRSDDFHLKSHTYKKFNQSPMMIYPWSLIIMMILLTDKPWWLHAAPVIQHTQAGCRWKSTTFLIRLQIESIGQGSRCSRWCVGKRWVVPCVIVDSLALPFVSRDRRRLTWQHWARSP